ncbi:hypothetical protein G7067_04085 [Leucobacter insecticola]|uniref:Gram-positive cocci surface proteins LPxTG domain-containing protein n=1 Tax=Leucobacter insecticola TaxID=2714934 RepID=A0A6G8FH40_9MICO|nr:RCC1 domain-containing protein [Leucobacter insecticola]QIM15780.1 hypothetical protein G7067_04085 [Leucobacter insecticola]
MATVGLVATALTLPLGVSSEAQAVPGDLEEWSGTVLGGTEIELPERTDKLEFKEIYGAPNAGYGMDTDNKIWGWGLNGYGNLGNNEYIGYFRFAPHPVPMKDINGDQMVAKTMSFGDNSALVLDRDNKAWTYGRNAFGELGNPNFPMGGNSSTYIPQPVLNEGGEQMVFETVSSGTAFHFGLEADGSAWAWGRNWFGQLGTATPLYQDSQFAAPVIDSTGQQMKFKQIAGGSDFAIGIDFDGNAYGWGSGDGCASGFCGLEVPRPRPLLDASGQQRKYAAVHAGYGVAYGVEADGSVWSWGQQLNQALGNPATPEWSATGVPQKVLAADGTQFRVKSMDVGTTTVFALDEDHHVWGWGGNQSGQLGQDPAVLGTASAVPVQIFAAPGVPIVADQVQAGNNHGIYLGEFDEVSKTNVFSWGESELGQLGNPGLDVVYGSGSFELTPVPVQLAQPSLNSIVYFGDDDSYAVTGTVSGGVLTVKSPEHFASRVPVYVAWYGSQPPTTRELVGYFTFMLDPALTVSPESVEVGESTIVTVTLPDAEIALVGESQMQFALDAGLTTVAEGATGAVTPVPFDADGKATLLVTSVTDALYDVTAQALVNQVNGAPIDQGPMVAVSPKVSGVAAFVAPDKPEKPVTPPVTPPTTPDTLGGLSSTGSSTPVMLIGGGVLALLVGAATLLLGCRRKSASQP